MPSTLQALIASQMTARLLQESQMLLLRRVLKDHSSHTDHLAQRSVLQDIGLQPKPFLATLSPSPQQHFSVIQIAFLQRLQTSQQILIGHGVVQKARKSDMVIHVPHCVRKGSGLPKLR
eukprot:gnl/MRDRNA2_/MRDRNA2_729105_c0_seq1.p2 gnl/MRDRNA2_/MRDRNA2_729105_c0~~gnl/MRDRNA2_/MRDRNA2_729105_c0_seq1.p2  ORF type:complete len:119 (+),score=15.19 gnl/MRDRNA2_/MRDRNA2_729105_c0_seq1:40-396(+)